MAVCRLVLLDAVEGIGQYDEEGSQRYSQGDLQDVRAFAEWLLEENIKKWPLWDYPVAKVLAFCEKRLANPKEGK